MTHDRAAAPTDSTKARPATHRTGFFAIKQAVNRHKTVSPGIQHKALCKAHGKAVFGAVRHKQGTFQPF